jgi:diaminopimelate decarboxylase
VAGPACFAGDLLAEGRSLPLLEPGDHAAALDTGAYYFAHHYAYNSLPRPGIYGYAPGDGRTRFAVVRRAQTVEQIVAEAGGAERSGLLGL